MFKQRAPIIIILLCITLLMGCATMQRHDDPVKGAFYEALAGYNDALESYINIYDTVPEETTVEINALFDRGGKILNTWQTAIVAGYGDPADAQAAYLNLKNDLFKALISIGLLEVTND